jgi:hypothetical protein
MKFTVLLNGSVSRILILQAEGRELESCQTQDVVIAPLPSTPQLEARITGLQNMMSYV